MHFASFVCIGILLLPWFPCTWGKCIFDQVQRSVKVVSPPTGQYASAHWPLRETAINIPVTASEENLARVAPQRPKRAEQNVESIAVPQPIRINVWIPSESPKLSDWERERLMTAVDEAVSEVSSLLSGEQCYLFW